MAYLRSGRPRYHPAARKPAIPGAAVQYRTSLWASDIMTSRPIPSEAAPSATDGAASADAALRAMDDASSNIGFQALRCPRSNPWWNKTKAEAGTCWLLVDSASPRRSVVARRLICRGIAGCCKRRRHRGRPYWLLFPLVAIAVRCALAGISGVMASRASVHRRPHHITSWFAGRTDRSCTVTSELRWPCAASFCFFHRQPGWPG